MLLNRYNICLSIAQIAKNNCYLILTNQKCPDKIQGQTNTLTPKVLENNLDQHFLRPGRSHDGIWRKLVYQQKFILFFEKISLST